MKYANMHLHTVYSDGVLTPLELCDKAKDMGYKALSITDHNTASGHKSFQAAAEKLGLDYILGMEMNTVGDRGFHIVAYDFDATENGIAEYMRYDAERVTAITKAKFDALVKSGYIKEVSWQNVLEDAPADCSWFCNEQIFASLVKRTALTQTEYWDFIKKFHSQRVEVNMPVKNYTAKEIIRIIRNAGGVASLAHPHEKTQFLPELYGYGLTCVEIDHPDIDAFDAAKASAFAESHNMYVSGGTDHTGRLSNYPELRGDPQPLGDFLQSLSSDVRCGITQEQFMMLKGRHLG